MLKRIFLSMVMVGIAFATGYATAQSYFLNQAPASSNGSAGKNQPAADNFQSQTQQQLDKKNQALDNQLSQELAKIPPPPPPPPPHEEAQNATGSLGQESGQTPAAGLPPKTAAPTASAPLAQDITPAGPSPAAPPATAPEQTEVYTGFQNSKPSETPAPSQNQPSSGSGGGWNIKY